MKIALIANYKADRQESMLRYADLLARELHARGHAVRVVAPPVALLRLFGESSKLAKWIAYVDKYLLAPPVLWWRTRGTDVVHVCDHSNSMYLGWAGSGKRLITCHDTLAIQAAQGRFAGVRVGSTGRVLQRWIARGLVRAPFVICVSRKTQLDLQELAEAGHAPQSVVIHNPLNWSFHPVGREAAATLLRSRNVVCSASFFMHVGSNSWYKNRPAVVRIFAALKNTPEFAASSLLLVGKTPDPDLLETIAASGVQQSIFILDRASNEDLRALYSGAEALLFPSREEGFGWPIIEAQACGCVVVTSDREPMREIGAPAAIFIDPDTPEQAAHTIAAAHPRFAALRSAGLENVERFAVGIAMDAYESAYRSVISGSVISG